MQNAKPRLKAYKLSDERGMFLLVQPNGGKWWRLKYRRPGTKKENLLSLGTYPDVTLKRAREKRDDARRLIADGIDPSDKRKADAIAGQDTFESIAREWFAKHQPHWGTNHADNVIERLTRDVFPWLGNIPVANLSAHDVLGVLRRVEARGTVETAHRELGYCGQIMRYAVATGRAATDCTRDLRGALGPVSSKHFAAITEPSRIGELWRAIAAFSGNLPTRCALQLSALTFARPSEVRLAEWSEFDFDQAEWNIPAARMKMRQPHLVPLPSQAIEFLLELRPLTGTGKYLFPGARDRKKPMSNATVNAALRRMGYDKHTMTGHGFRAMARTVLDEVLNFRPDYIEHQLAHAVRDPLGRAYNRTAHLHERRKMMQAWADYLDIMSKGASVVSIRRTASKRP